MQVVIAFLFFAAIAGAFTSSWNWAWYATMGLASAVVCGLYLFAEGFW